MKLATFISRHRRGLGLLAAGLVGVALGLLMTSELPRRWSLERRASSWKPTPADLAYPNAAYIAKDVDLNGVWLRTGMDYVRLDMRSQANGEYEVGVDTGGCLGSFDFERVATFHEGSFQIDRPIVEYRPVIYNTLYAVRLEGREYLLPACHVTEFNAMMADSDHGYISQLALAREEPSE